MSGRGEACNSQAEVRTPGPYVPTKLNSLPILFVVWPDRPEIVKLRHIAAIAQMRPVPGSAAVQVSSLRANKTPGLSFRWRC